MKDFHVNSDRVCPYCFSDKSSLIKDTKSFKLYHCPSCLLEFFTPRVYDNSVYESSKVGNIYNQYHKLRNVPTMWLLKMIDWLKNNKYDFNGKKIIEIGAGDALNFDFLKKNFPVTERQYEVLEFDAKSVEACKKRGLKIIYQEYFNLDFAKQHINEYDLVIVTEVIEHQTHLKEFIDSLFTILNPNGLILLSTPNLKRPLFRIGEKTDMPPHHFLRFSKNFFELNFKKELFDHQFYFFTFPIMIDYSKAVSFSKFKNNIFWPLFIPVFILKHILSKVTNNGEGHFLVFKKN